MADLLGYAAADMLGRPIADFVAPGSRALAASRLERPGQRASDVRDFLFCRRDGADLWAIVATSPLPDVDGNAGGVLWMITDVTERLRAEEDIHQLSHALTQTADTVAVTDRDGLIVWVNAAFEQLTCYSKQEVIGKTPRILKSGEQDQRFYADLWKTILSGRVFRGVFINRKKTGELYFSDHSITPIMDERGSITHFVASGRDLTGKRRVGEALREDAARLRDVVEDMTERTGRER